MSVSELKAFALCARNFALAEKQSCQQPNCDLVVPCAACYLGLVKARKYLEEYPKNPRQGSECAERRRVDLRRTHQHTSSSGRAAQGYRRREHRLQGDSLLDGLRVACYYGCQLVRPYALFDDGHQPSTMDTLLRALGAKTVDWPLKTRCCGGSLTGTIQDVGLRLSQVILTEAIKRGANVVATACPCASSISSVIRKRCRRASTKRSIFRSSISRN